MIFAKGFSIELTEKKCLNFKHNGVECNHCIEHCPTGAIIYENSHIYLVKDKCNGCGLCFNDCPTEVFRTKQWDENTIISDIEDEKWKVTEFFCGRHTSPYQTEKGRERGAVQLPACLTSISKGTWYELGLMCDMELHLEQCEGCPIRSALTRLDHNIRTASEWLEASGYKPEINVIYESGKGKIKKKLKAIETGLKVTSRRDLFLSVINKGRQLNGNGPGFTRQSSSEPDSRERDVCLPEWQKRLAKVFAKNRKEEFPAAYWPTIKINDKCVYCGMCSNNCPSGTLQVVVKDDQSIRKFRSGFCLDCRICQLFCPREAISRDREKVEKPFEEKTIQTLPVVKCRQCKSITVADSGSLCYWCQGEAQNDQELVEAMKKYFLTGKLGRTQLDI